MSLAGIKSAFLNMVTGKDNRTHDPVRWSLVVSVAAVLAHDAWQLHQGVTVAVRDLAMALSALVASHGAALGFKASTEPDPPKDGQP